ncbi:MAG: heterodisulfide reductase subunit A [Candidatus Syntrophoarchaeum caldarius]|uniref:CoB--CoM heterodisulfide reductase iron-sulfur subunit A n=1 Tax=Candidatus Syntropharchaeum caldarium TaxID=1838285 RepID=A0A1F2PBL6_9EURY|nr:MAG: heterodisulfide reductase subunit A [Candidatus Syntrophoarchaeum caldarius]
MRIGVYVCHCGINIGATVDVKKVAEFASHLKDVVISREYSYMCSDPGQELIKKDIRELGLDRVVVASCSPRMHEPTFRTAVAEAGLNPYLFEMANIREHCSWVHDDRERATEKAMHLVAGSVYKSKLLEPLEPMQVGITKKALVMGAGIAGIQTALDIADSGFEVYLVERSPSVGGKMAQLDKTFPTLDCSACILTPKMVDAGRHPNIELMTYSEVIDIDGYVGNFKVKIKKKPRFIDIEKCTGCGECASRCPVDVPNEFDEGIGIRSAIYIPFPQAVPLKYTIDRDSCIRCGTCKNVCKRDAIDYDQTEEIVELDVGAIVAATGYDLMDVSSREEYGYGRFDNVITGLEFERLCNASGPTGGKILTKDGREPKDVIFIQCVGSREIGGNEYCSRFCCMYTAKHAHLVEDRIESGKAKVLFTDARAYGKGFEEFYVRVMEEGVDYYRRDHDKPVSVTEREDGKLIVTATALDGSPIELEGDMVVLATAATACEDAFEVSRLLNISRTGDGFFMEAHPKLRPIDTPSDGIFLAGCSQGPKDIPDTVAQASGAASQVLNLLAQDSTTGSPSVSEVNQDICIGCATCFEVCPYGAIEMERLEVGWRAKTNEVVCKGCGICAGECPALAINVKHFTDEQIINKIEGVLADLNEVVT